MLVGSNCYCIDYLSVELRLLVYGICFGVLSDESDCRVLLIFFGVMGVGVQSKGWKPKSKSLEEVLKSTLKAEGKLLGYDETPIDVTEAAIIEPIMVEGDQCSSFDPEIFPIGGGDEVVEKYPPHSTTIGKQLLSSSMKGIYNETIEHHERDCDPQRAGTV